jgi:multiple sugar transport system permease protein
MVALSAVFKMLFRADGVINEILMKWFHVSKGNLPNWLSDGSLSRIPVVALMIYTGLGFCMLIYIAALQDIPKELYEAATIDGASDTQKFWKITFPLISPTTFYLLVIRMISTFQIFVAINVITESSKASGSVSMVVLIYEEAFKKYNFGYASAESWILVLIILLVTVSRCGDRKNGSFTNRIEGEHIP